jgi:TonB family protein
MKRWTSLAVAAVLVSCRTPPPVARNTPLKIYEKEVVTRMEAVWSRLSSQYMAQLALGTVKILCRIQPDGRVANLRIVSNSGNGALLSEVARRTVQQTKIPPLPPMALAELPDGYMPFEFTFIVARVP